MIETFKIVNGNHTVNTAIATSAIFTFDNSGRTIIVRNYLKDGVNSISGSPWLLTEL